MVLAHERYLPGKRNYPYIIRNRVEKNSDKPFLISGDRCVTYAEFDQVTNRIAAALWELGVRKGDHVAFMLPNSFEIIFFWQALTKIGAVEVPIHDSFKGHFLTHILNDSQSRLLAIDSKFLPELRAVQKDLTALENIIVVPDFDSEDQSGEVFNMYSYKQFEQFPETGEVRVTVRDEDLVSIMYSSGTTGPPKGIMRVHHHDYYIAAILVDILRFGPEDVYHTALPYSHGISQYMVTTPALLTGGAVVFEERFSASRFLQTIRRYGATHSVFVASMIQMLYIQAYQPTDQDNPLKAILAIGVPEGLGPSFEERFSARLVQAYGSTEQNVIAYRPWERRDKPDAVGSLHPAFETRIVDEYDHEVPAGHVGEIVCRSKIPWTLLAGYYNQPEATAKAFRNFWFHTGDLGHLDEEGFLYFDGRKKDAIRRRGENISATEIERIVNEYPGVRESATVGVASELGEEEVKVVLAMDKLDEFDRLTFFEFCQEKMPAFMVPRYVELKRDLPKTSTQKVEKYKLKEEGVTSNTWDQHALKASLSER